MPMLEVNMAMSDALPMPEVNEVTSTAMLMPNINNMPIPFLMLVVNETTSMLLLEVNAAPSNAIFLLKISEVI